MLRVIVLMWCVTGASADIYKFEKDLAVDRRTLAGHYFFHVKSDAGLASVTFKNFEIKWSGDKAGPKGYKSLQVSLIPWSNFWKLVDQNTFCSAERRLIMKENFPTFTVGSKRNATFSIKATDVYLLAISNCGEADGATVAAGDVIVKQVHGHLPGNKTFTLKWWGWFSLVNVVLCIMWAIALARHWKALLHLHKMIAAATTVAFLEAVSAYFQYMEWNNTGSRSMTFITLTMFFYALKYVLTLRMLIETVSGSGIIMERLEVRNEVKMDVTCSIFLMTQWIWKSVISYKYLLMLDKKFLLMLSVPGTLFWFGIFVWVYRQFHTLLTKLQDKKLASEAVKVFTNMRLVLVGSLLLATVVLLLQLTDIVMSATPWELQWVPYDGAPHAVYTVFLLGLMILWWPHEDSWKLGYSDQVDQDENETGGDGKVEAQQIGVAESAEVL